MELKSYKSNDEYVDDGSTEFCSTHGGCPFAFSNKSELIQSYGCIPTHIDIVNMRLKYDKTWACHSDEKKPCLGAIKHLKEKNLPFKVVDKKLVTLDDNWEQYIK